MTRTTWTRDAIALVAAALVMVPTVAWPQSRPDLADITASFDSPQPGLDENTMRFSVVGGTATDSRWGAFGARYVYRAANSRGTLGWIIYEPDKISRRAVDASIQQSAHVVITGVGRTPAAPSFVFTAIVDGCKAKAAVKGGTSATWQLSCPSTTLDSLGLTPAQKTAFANLFGSASPKIVGKTP